MRWDNTTTPYCCSSCTRTCTCTATNCYEYVQTLPYCCCGSCALGTAIPTALFVLQDRASPSSSHQGGEEDATVRIEVFAHGAIGKEAVLVASLSNSVLLVMRIGGRGEGVRGEGNGLRSWLLDWPVSGKVRTDGSQCGVVRTVPV